MLKRFLSLLTVVILLASPGAWAFFSPTSLAGQDSLTNPSSGPPMTGLTAWYRADQVTTSGGNVTAWPDKSGNGYTLTQSGGNVPYQATDSDFNSQPSVSFVTANAGFLQNTSFSDFSDVCTVYIPVNVTALDSGGGGIFDISNGSATNTGISLFSQTANTISRIVDTGGQKNASWSKALPVGPSVLRMVYGASSVHKLYENATERATNGTTLTLANTLNTLTVGRLFNASTFDITMETPEIIIYNREIAAGSADDVAIRTYFNARYGMGL